MICELQAQVNQEWVARYNGPLTTNSDDKPVAIVKDHSGNVLVAGNTYNNLTNYDFYIIKYNSSGLKLWSRIYTNTSGLFSSSEELVKAVAIDNNNFIYVTGTTCPVSNNSTYDILTVKYNPEGDTIWSKRYNGPGNNQDIPVAISIDITGFIYIAAESFGINPNSFNYTVLKYESNGSLAWETRFGFPPILYDRPTSIRVDITGNIYLTGYSNYNNYDYLTVKFNSSGIYQWDKRYEGPAGYKDYAYDITSDHSENIYITGISCQSSPFENYDCATVKYNSNGDEIWVRRYNGPGNWWDFARSVKVDLNDNVYITGYSKGINSAYDILTIKYDSAGTEQWTARYNGSFNDSDKAFISEVDENGNIYIIGQTKTVNGYDIITLKYNNSGELIWNQTINGLSNGDDVGRDILIDNSSVYITGESDNGEFKNDFTIAKYNINNGDQIWLRTENERTYYPSNDFPYATAVDSGNNIYSGGASQGINGYDFLLMKYDSTGNKLWESRYNGEANGDDQIIDIAIDRTGSTYAIGQSQGINSNLDMIICKYDPEGNVLWTRKYDNNNYDDIPYSVAIDRSNNIYFTGYSKTSSSTEAIITLKYNSDGIQQWVNVFGNGSGRNRAYDIVLDDSSNVYITGVVSTNNGDYITMKLNSQGELLWSSNFNYQSDEASAIAIDNSSNVYVTGIVGERQNFTTYYSIRTIKYNSAGVQQWVRIYGFTMNRCSAYDILINNDEYVIIAGYYPQSSNTSKSNYLTIKYGIYGNEYWNRSYDGAANDDDKAFSVKADNENNIYVTGQSETANNLYDITTIKYDASGILKWQKSYDGPIHSNDIGFKLVLDNSLNVYTIGYSMGYGTENDFVLIKYNQNTVGIQNVAIQEPQNYSLKQNYPNPFNPSSKLEFGIPELGFVSLKVYDALGKEVRILVNEIKPTGYYTVEFDGSDLPSGVYFYRLEAGEFSETKRMVLLK